VADRLRSGASRPARGFSLVSAGRGLLSDKPGGLTIQILNESERDFEIDLLKINELTSILYPQGGIKIINYFSGLESDHNMLWFFQHSCV
jgi:hypothetical protein